MLAESPILNKELLNSASDIRPDSDRLKLRKNVLSQNSECQVIEGFITIMVPNYHSLHYYDFQKMFKMLILESNLEILNH